MGKFVSKITGFFLIATTILLPAFLFSAKSTGFWRFIHLVTLPQDLFEPIVLERFRFDEDGYSKKYELHPKYRGFYTIQICNFDGFKSSDFDSGNSRYGLKGKFKIELFKGEEKVVEKIVTNWTTASLKNNNLKMFETLSIYEFPIPIKGFNIKDMILRFSVIEPSPILKNHGNDIKLQVKVSPNK